jgi:hypothetical protein
MVRTQEGELGRFTGRGRQLVYEGASECLKIQMTADDRAKLKQLEAKTVLGGSRVSLEESPLSQNLDEPVGGG